MIFFPFIFNSCRYQHWCRCYRYADPETHHWPSQSLCALTVDSSTTTLSPPTPPTPPYSLEGITPSPRRGSGFEDPTRLQLGKTLRKHENCSHLQLCDLRTSFIRFWEASPRLFRRVWPVVSVLCGGSSLKNTTDSWKPWGEEEQGFGRLDFDWKRRLTQPDRMFFECTQYDAEVSRSAAVGSKQMDFAGNWLHLGIKEKNPWRWNSVILLFGESHRDKANNRGTRAPLATSKRPQTQKNEKQTKKKCCV